MLLPRQRKKRRRRFRIGLALILSAMLVCIGILVGAYFITRAQVNEELGITEQAVTTLLPYCMN